MLPSFLTSARASLRHLEPQIAKPLRRGRAKREPLGPGVAHVLPGERGDLRVLLVVARLVSAAGHLRVDHGVAELLQTLGVPAVVVDLDDAIRVDLAYFITRASSVMHTKAVA